MRQRINFLSFLLLLLSAPALSAKQALAVVYGLCAQNVEQVALTEQASGVVVDVKLAPEAAAEFEVLSHVHLGELLAVVAGREVIFRAVTQVPVGSGLLRSSIRSREEAVRLQQAILQHRQDNKCGVIYPLK